MSTLDPRALAREIEAALIRLDRRYQSVDDPRWSGERERAVRRADANDRRRFDAYLLGYLLHAVDDTTRKDALEAAAADVNGATA